MIVNETLPVIADPVLGGGIPSVVVSTALIVMYEFLLSFIFSIDSLTTSSSFSEIIPQSICTRHGLAIGAKMAWFVRILIYGLVSFSCRYSLCF